MSDVRYGSKILRRIPWNILLPRYRHDWIEHRMHHLPIQKELLTKNVDRRRVKSTRERKIELREELEWERHRRLNND